jgi:hypothetical protein
MRKLLTENCGIENAKFMTFEQLLLYICTECGDDAVEEFVDNRKNIYFFGESDANKEDE